MEFSEQLRARLTRDDAALLSALARQERMRPSTFVRHLLREEGRKRGLWPPAQQAQSEQQACSG
jgi:hypothetical protein